MKRFYVCAIVMGVSVSLSFAGWKNTTFLAELNDFENGYIPDAIRVTADEDYVLFNRSTPTKLDALWEAFRNPETGLFDQQRQLSELKYGGAQVYGSWVSDDKLRLYYAACDPQTLQWTKRPIWMAIRNSVDAPWVTIERYEELEIEAFPNDCTLTADEKTIMFEAASWSGGGIRRIFTASRPSLLHKFSNIREIVELEEMQAWRPRISSDGLSVYFRVLNTNNQWEVWMGDRESLDQPFDNFKQMEWSNKTGVSIDPWLSSDGQRLYYRHRPTEILDVNDSGIYIAEWVDETYHDAVRLLQEAAADKESSIELIQDAYAKEKAAMTILQRIPAKQLPAGVNKKDFQKSLLKIKTVINKDAVLVKLLKMELKTFQYAIVPLIPPVTLQ